MNVFDVLREKLKESANVDIGHHFSVEHNVAIKTKDAIEIVNQVEQMYNNGWIPVSERLPDTKDNILICTRTGYVNVGYYSIDVFKDGNSVTYEDVIAWKPLPAAYKDGMSTTNADRIRSMTDEELTKIIMCPYDTAGEPIDIMPCVTELGTQEFVSSEYCNKCMMNWLRREVNV